MRTPLLLFVFLIAKISAQTVTIQFTGIRSAEGTIRVSFFNTQQSFEEEKPIYSKTISKAGLSNGRLKVDVSPGLKPGIYGIAVLDDENSNQKMDYGLLLPKEGFGFSDYYHTGMKRPKLEQFDFILGDKAVKSVEVKVRYL